MDSFFYVFPMRFPDTKGYSDDPKDSIIHEPLANDNRMYRDSTEQKDERGNNIVR